MEKNDADAELVGIAIEKALIKIGMPTYEKVHGMLQGRYATFADCYSHPEMLSTILNHIFGAGSTAVMDTIKKELHQLEDHLPIAQFLKIIN